MRIRTIIPAVVLSLALAAPAAAQNEAAGVAFAGCWAPSDGASPWNRICIVPTGTSMLEFTTITPDGKVTESLLSLDGARVPVKSEECEGWEEGRLTSDGERIIISAEVTCGSEPKQVRSTAFTITPSGDLMKATGTGFGMVATAQVRVYSPVSSYAMIPPATRESLMPYLVSAEAARLGVRANAVSARDLVEFERLGVAPVLIDLMVAASYPKSFVIDAVGAVASAAPTQGQQAQRPMMLSNPYMFMNGYPMLSMYDWQMMFECRRIGFGCPIGGLYGYSGFGYGFGGWGGWGGWGGGYYGGYGIPVVVRPVVTPGPSGRAVRGRGYTQTGSGNGGGTATPRAATSTSGGSATAHSGGSGGASSSSGGSSSGSTARTAKPRP